MACGVLGLKRLYNLASLAFYLVRPKNAASIRRTGSGAISRDGRPFLARWGWRYLEKPAMRKCENSSPSRSKAPDGVVWVWGPSAVLYVHALASCGPGVHRPRSHSLVLDRRAALPEPRGVRNPTRPRVHT